MFKKKNDKKSTAVKEPLINGKKVMTVMRGETPVFVMGLLCLIFAVYMTLAFISFFVTGAADQSLLEHPASGELLNPGKAYQNYAGALGARMAEFLINKCFGIAAFFIIVFLIATGMKMMKAYEIRLRKWFLVCATLMIWFSVALGFLSVLMPETMGSSFLYAGGVHGQNICLWLGSQLGLTGVGLLLLVTAVVIAIYLRRSTMNVVRKVLHPDLKRRQPEGNGAEEIAPVAAATAATATEEAMKPAEPKPQPERTEKPVTPEPEPEMPLTVDEEPEETYEVYEEPEQPETEMETELEEEEKVEEPVKPTAEAPRSERPFESKPSEVRVEEQPAAAAKKEEEPVFEISEETAEETATEEADSRGDLNTPYNPRLDLENYHFPTLDLLNSYTDNSPSIDMIEQNANKDRIIKVLRNFGIEISSIKASVGPTITLYEITPAEGVRISKIRNLEDDIALSLAALGIRIIAPIPGKGTIGIEVPNANPRIVPMQSILNSKKFQETTFDLPVALGKTITNEVFMVDLAKAPHMLVAGATGQGKSVGLNAIVTSLLYKKHPSELKFVIIDPKKVEFAIYAPIEKHFLAKLPDGGDAIITDVTKVVQTLNSLCVEMDQRYDLLKMAGCRTVKEYNAKFIARQLNPNNGHRYLPYIVIIIDEFGDLIMTAGKEVELPICRIAQLARAVGIHAIIATQRPTTNIITGTIKANFPARVAFRVASMMDSRTILDRSGAQQLVGKGDMLYLQGNDPVRVQCAFVDTPEVERIANFISKQQGYPTAFMLPEYVDENADLGGAADVDMNRLDPLFEEAARLVIYNQQGSTSLIQRKFSIGYNRAGRIMDQLEKAGIVGPANGSKARDVLCLDENDLQMRMSSLKD